MSARRLAVVPAAGSGSRFGQATPKQYTLLAGQPLLAHTLAVLCTEPRIDQVWVVISPDDDWFEPFGFAQQAWAQSKLRVLRQGGATRAESVRNGLAALDAAGRGWQASTAFPGAVMENQPLAALRTLSSNAIRFLERGDEATARSNLERVAQLVDRMGQITGHLKVFAHKSSGAPRPVDVRAVVNHAIGILGQRLRVGGARVVLDFPPAPLWARCDANRLEQVMVNLLGNALDAMANLDQPRIEVHGAAHGAVVRIEVRDYGSGLSAEAQSRLFEPFYTTKEAGVGLGLGLAISAGIVSDYGGTLAGANHPDGGALFTLELPVAPGEGEECEDTTK